MPIRFLSKALVAALALTGALSATAETRTSAEQRKATAVLQFRVIVPAVLQVIQNEHPHEVRSWDGASFTGRQLLALRTNSKSEICIDFHIAVPSVAAWDIDVISGAVRIESAQGSKRVCLRNPGAHRLVLEHQFVFADEFGDQMQIPQEGRRPWPVITQMASL